MIDVAARSRWSRALLIPLTILAWLAVVIVAGWLASHVARALLTLILSGLIAFALTPLVSLLARFLPRVLAIVIAYLVGFAIVFGLIGAVVVTAATEVQSLVRHLPEYGRQLQAMQPQALSVVGRFGITSGQLAAARDQLVNSLQQQGTRVAADTVDVVRTVLGTVVDAVLILILSIYLTASGPRLGRWLREQAPQRQRRRAGVLIGIVNHVVGGYIRGTLTLATLVGVLVGGGMWVLHVRYALLLGVLAFFMEFIPVLGVLVSGAVCVVIALFQGWVLALVVLAYFVFVHVIEGDVVGPRIMGRAVGIHPAVALLALVAGTELFGVWGALFGAPIAGLIQAVVEATYREVRLVRTAAAVMGAGQVEVTLPEQPEAESRPGPERRTASS